MQHPDFTQFQIKSYTGSQAENILKAENIFLVMKSLNSSRNIYSHYAANLCKIRNIFSWFFVNFAVDI